MQTNFRKLLKRIRDAEKSGAGAQDVEPSLWYFEEMGFLVTQETPTASISTKDISENVHNEDRADANKTSYRTVRLSILLIFSKFIIHNINVLFNIIICLFFINYHYY